jgi:hypothetical protein
LFIAQAAGEMQAVMARLQKLDEAQRATVDSTLTEIKRVVSSKALAFNKDHLMDLLLGLKMVACETKHPKAGYFATVLEAMRDKLSNPYEQFKRYILVLLGDKDHERVLEAMAKVDKAMRTTAPMSTRDTFSRRGRVGRFANIPCFQCPAYGHYKSHCPVLAQQSTAGRQPPAKKGKWSADMSA